MYEKILYKLLNCINVPKNDINYNINHTKLNVFIIIFFLNHEKKIIES